MAPAWGQRGLPLRRAVTVVVCVALAALELVHPPSAEGAADWWLPLHVALIAGYALLTWQLWQAVPMARVLLAVFGVANAAFLAIEGVLVGVLAVTFLANATGAAWCLVLLVLAAEVYPAPRERLTLALLALTWLVFVASATPFVQGQLLSRAVTIVTAAWLTYRGGPAALPSAVLVFGAVLRQHVGPEAALGLLCLAFALGWRAR